MAVKLEKYISKAINKIDKASEKKMQQALDYAKKKTEDKLGKTGSGRTYKVPGTDRTYTASSPGNPPASYTGDLEESIKTQIKKTKFGPAGKIGSTDWKSYWQEMGTRKQEPRPFLGPTLREENRKIRQILGRKWF